MGVATRGPVSVLIAVVCLLSLGTPAAAQNSGTISGAVFDQGGSPVVDATIRVSGEQLPEGRVGRTDDNGFYRLEYLPPGEYTLIVEQSGAGLKRTARVELGRDTQVDFVLGVALEESIAVTAARPVVDVRSSEVSFNFNDQTLNALPLDRSYRGMLQLIPGVGDNRSRIGPAAGGSRQDNTYLIDGVNITNPGFGHLGTEVNELDIAELNIKRAGISAEFGRTGGTVANAITRSGTNRLSGMARIDWLPEALVAGYELPDDLVSMGVQPGTFRDPLLTTQFFPAVGVGGPVRRDHVFFYGSISTSREAKWDRINKVGTPLPDEVRTGRELFGKLTAVPTERHQVNLSYRHHPSEIDNALLDSTAAPSLATVTDNGSRIMSADWAYFIGPRRSMNVRYLYMGEENEDVPLVDLGLLPAFNPANLAAMGQFSDPLQADLRVGASPFANVQNYRRHQLQGTFTELFDLGRSSHVLKAGAGYDFGEEELSRLANGWGAISVVNIDGVPGLRARYYTEQPPQLGRGHTYSLFVQDDVTIGGKLTVNAGVLLNRDDFSQRVEGSGGCPAALALRGGAAVYESSGDTCTFLRFGFGDEIQPRVGVSYRLRERPGDKVYGSWGRYNNMDQKSSARSLAPKRIFQTQTIFGLNGAVLSSGPLASTTGKLIDPALEPIYQDELVFGYATPLPRQFSLDVFFMHRRMENFIDDIPSRLNGSAPDSGPFVAANLPCAAFAACQAADARRTYKAFTVDVRKRLSDGWMTDVSYTWSRFEGNYDLDYALVPVFNTSSLIQDAPGLNVEDPNRSGVLMEDRPHVVKVFSSYAVGRGLQVSGYLRVQSGTPWNARGRDWAGGTLNYLEPAGSHRNPTWTNLDVMASYVVPFRSRVRLSLEARLLNAFDMQTRLSTDSLQYLDVRTIPTPPYYAPYQDPNPFYGLGNAFAPPRRLFLASTLSF